MATSLEVNAQPVKRLNYNTADAQFSVPIQSNWSLSAFSQVLWSPARVGDVEAKEIPRYAMGRRWIVTVSMCTHSLARL